MRLPSTHESSCRDLGDDGLLVADAASGQVVLLEGDRAKLWSLCRDGATLRTAERETGRDADHLLTELQALEQAGLVRESGVSRRTVLRVGGVAVVAAPVLTVLLPATAAHASDPSTGQEVFAHDFNSPALSGNGDVFQSYGTGDMLGPFTVTAGTVDLVKHYSGYATAEESGQSQYLDTGGTSAGTITTSTFTAPARAGGYALFLDLVINPASPQNKTVTASIGSESYTVTATASNFAAGGARVSVLFTSTASGALSIANLATTDVQNGPLIDNISLVTH